MSRPQWQLKTPIDAVIFDCDGTLSAIEGIDELANINQVGDIVQELTADAMGKSGMRPELYRKRLDWVKPRKEQMVIAGQEYIKHQSPDIFSVIQLLHHLNKSIYIVSAGMFPAVKIFADYLKIPKEKIFAVHLQFDQEGKYIDFDHTSPMIKKYGKREVIHHLKNLHPTLAYVGDGLSDYEVYDLVDRFIGYGGAFYRENIEKNCEYYIKNASMSPLVPLLLTSEEIKQLNAEEMQLLQKGLKLLGAEM